MFLSYNYCFLNPPGSLEFSAGKACIEKVGLRKIVQYY